MSKLLLSESPLVVLPSLAVAFGNVNMAIILQQIHYWISDPRAPWRCERQWHYATYSEWQKQFPWLAEVTIRKLVNKLEEIKIVISMQPDISIGDQRKWYTIDYEALKKLELQVITTPIKKITPPDKKDHPPRSKVSALYREETKEETKQETAAYARAPASLNTKEKKQAKAVVAAFVEGAEKKGHGEFNYTPSTEPLVVDLGRIDISNDRAERLILKYGEARVREAMEYAQAKAKTNPGGYFEKTLAAEWGKGWKEKKEAPKEEDESIARRNQIEQERRKQREAYEAMAKGADECRANPGHAKDMVAKARLELKRARLQNMTENRKTIGAN